MVGLKDGTTTRARAITRVVPSARWDADRIQSISATSCTEKTKNLDIIENDMSPQDYDAAEHEPGPVDLQRAKRRLNIELKDHGEYGFSPPPDVLNAVSILRIATEKLRKNITRNFVAQPFTRK